MIAIIIIGIILIVISFRLPTGIAMAILLAYMIPSTIAIYSHNNPGSSAGSTEVQNSTAMPEPRAGVSDGGDVPVGASQAHEMP